MAKIKTWKQLKLAGIREKKRGFLNAERLFRMLPEDTPPHLRSISDVGCNTLSLWNDTDIDGKDILDIVREYRDLFKKAFGEWSDELSDVTCWYGDVWNVRWTGKVDGVAVSFNIECSRQEIEENNLLKSGCRIVERTKWVEGHNDVSVSVECST